MRKKGIVPDQRDPEAIFVTKKPALKFRVHTRTTNVWLKQAFGGIYMTMWLQIAALAAKRDKKGRSYPCHLRGQVTACAHTDSPFLFYVMASFHGRVWHD